MSDELSYVIESYKEVIDKHLGKDIAVSFFADSETYADSVEPLNQPFTAYKIKNDDYNVIFFQDFSIDKPIMLTDCCVCKIGGKTFVKVITPFTRERSYDFILTRSNEAKEILLALNNRRDKSHNGALNFPIIGLDFEHLRKDTIDFLLDEELRAFCIKKHIKLKRGLIFEGLPGCLSGDTVVRIKTENKCSAVLYTLNEAYVKFNRVFDTKFSDNRALWNKDIPKYIQSVVNGKLEYREIEKILCKGEKEIFSLATENGKTIKATSDHYFKLLEGTENGRGNLEVDGFVALENLVVGDKIYCKNHQEYEKKGRQAGRKEISGLKYHPNASIHKVNGKEYKREKYSRLIVEANMNAISIDDYISILKSDSEKASKLLFLRKDQVVHHKDWNAQNDSVDNLAVLTKKEHDTIHALNDYFGDTTISVETIVSIEKVGIEPVYDITMKDDDSRNFVANDIIVHNCGKSLSLRWLKTEAEKNGIEFRQFDNPKDFLDDRGSYYDRTKKHIFVFEDFDALLQERDNTGNAPNTVLSTVLNTLDGVEEITDVVSIFTTNKIELFDSAFIRPGRIDRVIRFDVPKPEQRLEFMKAYIPDYAEHFPRIEQEIANKMANVSFAVMKGICDDINIYEFNKGTLSIDDILSLIDRKLTGANKNDKVKDASTYIL